MLEQISKEERKKKGKGFEVGVFSNRKEADISGAMLVRRGTVR